MPLVGFLAYASQAYEISNLDYNFVIYFSYRYENNFEFHVPCQIVWCFISFWSVVLLHGLYLRKVTSNAISFVASNLYVLDDVGKVIPEQVQEGE